MNESRLIVLFLSFLLFSTSANSSDKQDSILSEKAAKEHAEAFTECAAVYDLVSEYIKTEAPAKSEHLKGLSNGAEASAVFLFEEANYNGRAMYDSLYTGLYGQQAVALEDGELPVQEMKKCMELNELQAMIVELLREAAYKRL